MAARKPRRATTKRKRNPPNPWLVLRQSGIHGRGVYARRHIPKGTRLIEYTGELIDNAEADRRYEDELIALSLERVDQDVLPHVPGGLTALEQRLRERVLGIGGEGLLLRIARAKGRTP